MVRQRPWGWSTPLNNPIPNYALWPVDKILTTTTLKLHYQATKFNKLVNSPNTSTRWSNITVGELRLPLGRLLDVSWHSRLPCEKLSPSLGHAPERRVAGPDLALFFLWPQRALTNLCFETRSNLGENYGRISLSSCNWMALPLSREVKVLASSPFCQKLWSSNSHAHTRSYSLGRKFLSVTREIIENTAMCFSGDCRCFWWLVSDVKVVSQY